jgi:hypothetical protein
LLLLSLLLCTSNCSLSLSQLVLQGGDDLLSG